MRNYRWWSISSNTYVMIAILLCLTLPVEAVVNTDRTRVVFDSDQMTQSLLMSNDGSTPVVLQVWLDKGNPASLPDQNNTPVVALPPVFKMLPGEVKSLRLMLSSRNALVAGRENLFWLNLYQIPPTQPKNGQSDQQVVLPLRLRMKVFVRPSGISVPQEEDAARLQFLVKDRQLQISNPTVWYISFNAQLEGQPTISNLMVGPQDNLTVPLTRPAAVGQSVSYEVINDTGNRWAYQARLR